MMKKFELGALKVLKAVVDKDISANKQVSSKCLALLYQPKRIVAQGNNKSEY